MSYNPYDQQQQQQQQQPYYPPYQGAPPQAVYPPPGGDVYNQQQPYQHQQPYQQQPPYQSQQQGGYPPQHNQQHNQQSPSFSGYPQAAGYPQDPHAGGFPQHHPQQPGPLIFLGQEIVPLAGMGYGHIPLVNLGTYNAEFDVERIRKATKGMGTDEKTLVNVLAPLSALQVHALSNRYEAQVGRSLVETIEAETKGDFENALRGLVLGPLGWDIWLIDRACSGMGTHEDLLTEILLGRTNQEIHLLKLAYKALLGQDLAHVVRGELSSKTERLFVMALAGTRDESSHVNPEQVKRDVDDLYKSGAGKIGTDEIRISSLLVNRSPQHLTALSQAYKAAHKHTLPELIRAEFSGDLEDSLLFIAEGAEGGGPYGVERDAEMLERAMKGFGTKDERLTWRIIRAHWDKPRFAQIKAAYQRKYRKSLAARVKGETGGDLEMILLAIIG